jgi:hypothetical protein
VLAAAKAHLKPEFSTAGRKCGQWLGGVP